MKPDGVEKAGIVPERDIQIVANSTLTASNTLFFDLLRDTPDAIKSVRFTDSSDSKLFLNRC